MTVQVVEGDLISYIGIRKNTRYGRVAKPDEQRIPGYVFAHFADSVEEINVSRSPTCISLTTPSLVVIESSLQQKDVREWL